LLRFSLVRRSTLAQPLVSSRIKTEDSNMRCIGSRNDQRLYTGYCGTVDILYLIKKFPVALECHTSLTY